ncbi:MAG: carbonic anhydrase [Planctomycetota bacterium]|jgi:hypothetical protein
MSYFTAINCMDGRVQVPVIQFIELKYRVDNVDMITEPGPVKALAEQTEYEVLQSIFRRVDVSLDKHASKGIAVAAHHDCAGNPVDEATQLEQLKSAVNYLTTIYPGRTIVGLWVNASWKVKIVCKVNNSG